MENSINTYRIRYLKDTSLQTAYVQGKDQEEATKEFLKIFTNIQSEKILSVVNIQENQIEFDISKIVKVVVPIFFVLIGAYGIYLGWDSYNQMSSNEDAKHTYPSYTKQEIINPFSSKKRSDPKSARRKDLRNSNSYSSSRDSFVFPKVFNSAEKSRCFEYDKPYTFKGKIVKKVYYDNETGNHNFLALELYKPICTLPKEYARRESEITHMQISSGGSNMVQKLEGRHVELKGSLYHSDNAHHFTKVLISLKSIERKESGHTSVRGKDSISPEFTNATMTQKTKEESMATGHKPVRTLKGHKKAVESVAFSPDGTKIASGSHDSTIKLWDVQSGELLNTFKGGKDAVESVSFSPDGTMIASGSYDWTIKLWDVQSSTLVSVIEDKGSAINDIAFSSDGTMIVSVGEYGDIKLWDVETGRLLKKLGVNGMPINSVAFSPDGIMIATGGGEDSIIRLWDIQSGKQIRTLKGHYYGLAFSPDGNQIASGDGKAIKLWNTQSGRLLNTLKGHKDVARCIAFSPDGTTIVSGGSNDDTVKLWNAKSGRLLDVFEGHRGSVNSVAFSPNGTKIVSGSYDKTIKLWDISSQPAISERQELEQLRAEKATQEREAATKSMKQSTTIPQNTRANTRTDGSETYYARISQRDHYGARNQKIYGKNISQVTSNKEVVNRNIAEATVSTRFLIALSTKSYSEAKAFAKKLSGKTSIPLKFRGLHYNSKLGLSLNKSACNDIDFEYPCYEARGRYDDGTYISVEYSNSYENFKNGYYIVVVSSGKESQNTLSKIKRIVKDAYIKRSNIYMGCMH